MVRNQVAVVLATGDCNDDVDALWSYCNEGVLGSVVKVPFDMTIVT